MDNKNYSKISLRKPDYGFFNIFNYPMQETRTHEFYLSAADSESLKTNDLMQFAAAVEKYESNLEFEEKIGNVALIILQNRNKKEVLDEIKKTIESSKAEMRVLSAQILRESPLSQEGSEYHLEILNLLDQASKVEQDESVLTWIVSAIGWTHRANTKKFLHQFVDHPSDGVRFGVASGWIRGCLEEDPFPDDIAKIAEILCKDQDSDNRWYSYSNLVDIAEFWGLKSGANLQKYNELICKGLSDSDPGVVHQAKLAIAHQKHKNIWTGDCDYDLMSKAEYLKLKNESHRENKYSNADYEIASYVYDKFDEI